MGGCEIDEESHRNCVCVQVKDIGRLAYRNVRGDRCSLSLWHGYLPTALDYRCVVGEGGLINYRGTMAGICVEEERAYLMY